MNQEPNFINYKQIIKKSFILICLLAMSVYFFIWIYNKSQSYLDLKQKELTKERLHVANQQAKKKFKPKIRISNKKDYAQVMNELKKFSKTFPNLIILSLKPGVSRLNGYTKHQVSLNILVTYQGLLTLLQNLEKDFSAIYWEEVKINTQHYPELNVKLIFSLFWK